LRRAITLAAASLIVALSVVAQAGAASPLQTLPRQYAQAVAVHDQAAAAQLRTELALLVELQRPRAGAPLLRLQAALNATRDALRPWPTVPAVTSLVAEIPRVGGQTRIAPRDPYGAIRDDLKALVLAARSGDRRVAITAAVHLEATATTLTQRLGMDAGTLTGALWSTSATDPGLLVALQRHADASAVAAAAGRTSDALTSAQQALGDVKVARATVVTDAAILVFREGLEAVLILAAITASFTAAKAHLRRPVLLGGLAGIAASVVTWFVAQFVIGEVGTGGLRLEAITGLLAIVVLLVVTNWFFHRVYWSQWIARFNRQRRRLEGIGFLSGQVVGLALLGLTSVYREGFETVLFLQNLQVSAGTSACVLGAGIGMIGVLAVGGLTFAAQRKLPYKRMLIATGLLIALVLAVMTGTTVHVMQGLGWLPSTPTPFAVPLWASRWLGVYATWEGLAAQIGALAIVLGSYVAAREIQVRRPQRRALASTATAATPPPAPAP
jgi:high-affinity iron transporter